MVDFNSLQSKFMRNYESNPQYRMLSYESALTQMVQDGVLTKAEYDQLIKTSAFGFGFDSNLGDSVDFDGKLYKKEELMSIYNEIVEEITSSYINEVLAYKPKPQQIVVHKCNSPDEIPDELIKIATQYKIPIFIESK